MTCNKCLWLKLNRGHCSYVVCSFFNFFVQAIFCQYVASQIPKEHFYCLQSVFRKLLERFQASGTFLSLYLLCCSPFKDTTVLRRVSGFLHRQVNFQSLHTVHMLINLEVSVQRTGPSLGRWQLWQKVGYHLSSNQNQPAGLSVDVTTSSTFSWPLSHHQSMNTHTLWSSISGVQPVISRLPPLTGSSVRGDDNTHSTQSHSHTYTHIKTEMPEVCVSGWWMTGG